MKCGVIDIGSNSVRLMISDGIKTLSKEVITTKLAEGMVDRVLKPESIERTVSALSFLCKKSHEYKVDKLYVFATAATRNAKNKDEFLRLVKSVCGVDVDVISGEEEAKVGYVGALSGLDGGIIDVGGASTEVMVVRNNVLTYVKSLNVGAVSVKDRYGQDEKNTAKFLSKKVLEYGQVPLADFYAIGGTATSVAAMLQELSPYDPSKVDGYVVLKHDLENLTNRLFSMTVDERKKLKGLQPERAEVIASGCSILLSVMKHLGVDKIIVSEKDNLEGYLKLKLEKK